MLQVITPASGEGVNYGPVPLGLLGQTVTADEVKNEILSRGYTLVVTATSPPVSPPVTTPKITRAVAIKAAVTNALYTYSYPERCTSSPLHCSLLQAQWNRVVDRGVYLANMYLGRGYVISPSLGGLSGLSFGQTSPPVPGMTGDEKIALALQLFSNVLATAGTYYSGRAERQRLQAMGAQIPAMTADEVQKMLLQYSAMNPTANAAKLQQVAAGAFDQLPPPSGGAGTPSWLVPAMVGVGVLALVSFKR